MANGHLQTGQIDARKNTHMNRSIEISRWVGRRTGNGNNMGRNTTHRTITENAHCATSCYLCTEWMLNCHLWTGCDWYGSLHRDNKKASTAWKKTWQISLQVQQEMKLYNRWSRLARHFQINLTRFPTLLHHQVSVLLGHSTTYSNTRYPISDLTHDVAITTMKGKCWMIVVRPSPIYSKVRWLISHANSRMAASPVVIREWNGGSKMDFLKNACSGCWKRSVWSTQWGCGSTWRLSMETGQLSSHLTNDTFNKKNKKPSYLRAQRKLESLFSVHQTVLKSVIMEQMMYSWLWLFWAGAVDELL